MDRLLVVGARPASLGAAVAEWGQRKMMDVTTAGISGEDVVLDVTIGSDLRRLFAETAEPIFDHIVCTVGINGEASMAKGFWEAAMRDHMEINAYAPLRLMDYWLRSWRQYSKIIDDRGMESRSIRPKQFIAISSNSAQVARSRSVAYCASKAALSMALRCTAREVADEGLPCVVTAYEPGWLEGTPMSEEVQQRLYSDPTVTNLHRIPGGKGIDVWDLAAVIVNQIQLGSAMFNGCTIRLDGGEQ